MSSKNLKSTGIVRTVDEIGRIVLPVELRRAFDIQEGDRLEIYTSGNQIVLNKATPRCAVCGRDNGEMHRLGNCHICTACAERIVERRLEGSEKMYVSLQHPDIAAIEATGYPTRMQRTAHVCPVCEQECEWVFTDLLRNPLGCDRCVRREPVEEYYGEI